MCVKNKKIFLIIKIIIIIEERHVSFSRVLPSPHKKNLTHTNSPFCKLISCLMYTAETLENETKRILCTITQCCHVQVDAGLFFLIILNYIFNYCAI